MRRAAGGSAFRFFPGGSRRLARRLAWRPWLAWRLAWRPRVARRLVWPRLARTVGLGRLEWRRRLLALVVRPMALGLLIAPATRRFFSVSQALIARETASLPSKCDAVAHS
jgi:hypothetical protein